LPFQFRSFQFEGTRPLPQLLPLLLALFWPLFLYSKGLRRKRLAYRRDSVPWRW
jgi:hypothetical protein